MTYMQIARAEDASLRLADAIDSMRNAMQELRGSSDQLHRDLATSLQELIDIAREDKKQWDEILEEADRLASQQMHRDYERSVL